MPSPTMHMTSWIWPRPPSSSNPYLPLSSPSGSRSSSPAKARRSSSDSQETLNNGYDDGHSKEYSVSSPPFSSPPSSPYPQTTGRSRFYSLRTLLWLARCLILLGLIAFAAFGVAMTIAFFFGKIILLPQYTAYDIAQAGWNRPALSLSSPSSFEHSSSDSSHSAITIHDFNLSNATQAVNDQHVLILSPLKNAEAELPHFFSILETLDHPKENTSIGFLVGDEEDATGSMVVDWVQGQTENGEYRHITLLRKDWEMHSPGWSGRHKNWVQAQRRSLMGKARTLLLTNTLNPTVDWVLWLDADVASMPSSLITDLLIYGNGGVISSSTSSISREEPFADVIVPNIMDRPHGLNTIRGYDMNSWAETPASLAMKSNLPSDLILHEGQRSLPTHRVHLARSWVKPNISASWDATSPDFPLDPANPWAPISNLYDENSEAYIGRKMELDAVGGVATLVRAQTHMYGAVFPSWAEDHQVETEGFGVLSKKVGARIVGLPNYIVWHPW